MEELTYKCMGVVNYPVINRTENLVLECDIRFAVSVQAGIADAAEYQKAAAGRDPGQYLKENMPRLLKEAMRTVWRDAIPMNAFSGALMPMQEAICGIIGAELSVFGLELRSFSILSLGINGEQEKALRAHDARTTPEKMEEILKNMQVDVQYRPEMVGVGPGLMTPLAGMPRQGPAAPSSRKLEPWNCSSCGMKNLTSPFCPQCGSPNSASRPWQCRKCGMKNLTGKFCPECGASRRDAETWSCVQCGAEDLTGKFCPKCGSPRPER